MIYFEYYCFIIPKMVIDYKYKGGLDQFKLDAPKEGFQEDYHLIKVSFLTLTTLEPFFKLVKENGLDYDSKANYSHDFAVYSFFGFWWPVDWLVADHLQCTLNPSSIDLTA